MGRLEPTPAAPAAVARRTSAPQPDSGPRQRAGRPRPASGARPAEIGHQDGPTQSWMMLFTENAANSSLRQVVPDSRPGKAGKWAERLPSLPCSESAEHGKITA